MTCIVCHTADPDPGRTIDARCLDRIDHDLARIAELTDLANRLWNSVPETRPDMTGFGVARAVLPIDSQILDDAIGTDTLPVLESWIRLVREEAGLSPYGVATEGQRVTVASSVQWLRSWLLWVAERPDFPIEDYAEEIRGICGRLTRYDPRSDPSRPHGTELRCPSIHPDNDGRLCHARIYFDRECPKDDIYCTRCGTTWTSARLRLLALHDDTQTIWAYPADILALVDIPAATLRQWVRRGHLRRDGGRYDIGQAWRRRMGVGA